MRVVAGKYRRRQLKSLPGSETRPMLDRMRETLFNILQNEVPGTVFADVYAGTGAVGIEALSRGAEFAIFIEKHRAAGRVIEDNLVTLDARRDAKILLAEASEALKEIEADIIFLGPPYPAHEEYEKCLQLLGEGFDGLVVAQHAKTHDLGDSYGRLRKYRLKKIGSNALSFYRVPDQEDSPS